jgi:hypothetical protein
MAKARGSLVKAERLLVVLVAFFFCMLPAASALVVGINIDIHNNTDLVAHDFHVKGMIESCCEPKLVDQFGWVRTPPETFPITPFDNITITDAGGAGGNSRLNGRVRTLILLMKVISVFSLMSAVRT